MTTFTSPWARFVLPFQTVFDAAGVTLPGAVLYFYQTGTATPLDTFSDANLTIPNTNPVVADAGGTFPAIFLQNLEYKVVLKDSSDNELWTADPVAPFIDSDPTLTSFYDLVVYFDIKPTNGETYPIFNVPRAVKLPATLTGSIFTVGGSTLPTATATFTLYKNGTIIGTIAFATTGAVTVSFLSDVSFAPGDQFTMIAPLVADATANFISFTFVFTVL